jgi:glutamate dehydrogenase/leucine dehydrogenase
MVQAFADVVKVAVKEKVSMRVAAYMVAIQRVWKVYELRGMYA